MLPYSSMIETLKRRIDISLKTFLLKIKKEYKFHLVPPILFESIKDFSLRKGKRIRPLLLILSYQGYSPREKRLSQSLLNASVCMELLHNFMLIHDDIIDQANLRRGKPTMHKILRNAAEVKDKEKLGADLGIIAGDIVYALAIDAFLSIEKTHQYKEKALKYFVKTAAFTAMGEFIDILHGVQSVKKIKEKDVFLNYSLKTARYTFECPLVIGAILSGAKDKDIEKLSRFGLLIGQAFQIQDDIIGLFGSQKIIGKPILSDLAEFKKTILVSYTYRKLSGKERRVFLKLFYKNKKTYQDLVMMRRIFVKSGSLHYSIRRAKILIDSAEQTLQELSMQLKYKNIIWGSLISLFKNLHEVAEDHGIPIRVIS